MKVSIIVSTRNRAHTITRALNSALKQSYRDFEIIVADDASSDDTQEVVREFMKCDNRIKYFRQEERLGIAPTWKKAFFEYASGDIITVLNDDDEFIDDNFLAKAVALFEKYQNQNIVCVFSNVIYKIENTGAENIGYPDGFAELNDGAELFFGDKFIFTDNGSIYKKEALLNLNLFDENISSLDLELLYKLMLIGDFCYLDSITYRHYLNAECMSFYSEQNIIKNFEASRWVKIVADFSRQYGVLEDRLNEWQGKKYGAILQLFFSHYEADLNYENYINNFYNGIKDSAKVVIYGTANAGISALNTLNRHRKDIEIIGFLDDGKMGEFFTFPILEHKDIREDYIIVIPSGNIKAMRKMIENIRKNKLYNEIVDIISHQSGKE